MSDFFMPQNDFWKKESVKAQTEQTPAQNINDTNDYWKKQSDIALAKKTERQENFNRYGVEVPDEHYEVFNKIISQQETPELAQEEAYKIGSAVKYSQMLGMPLLEAYKNVDALNEAQFTDLQGQKSCYEALSDMFKLGQNNVKLGQLGQKLMKAHAENDTELAQSLMAEIEALNNQNSLMQDNAPRTWVMEALEAGAQSLPFTGAVAGAGIIGNFIAPAVGTGAAFVTSSYLASGQEYIDMLNNGASPETARFISVLSGGVQGLIEADLGITSGIVKGSARAMGKEAAESFAKKSISEIENKLFKRFHFGAGKKLAVNFIENYGKNLLGEGTEEFLQEITSIVGQEVAASLDGYNIPDDDFNSIVKQTTEAFRGGVLGALSMGFIPAGINGAADIKEYKKIKDGAEEIESAEAFKNAVKDNPIFEGMSEDAKSDTINEIWKRAQQHKEEMAEVEAKKIAEVTDFAEGAELNTETEEGAEAQIEPTARFENGRLMIQENETDNEDGTTTVTFAAGDRTKKTNNRYGYISANVDEKTKTVTIDAFKMAPGRKGLSKELYDEFARKYAGYSIEWNAIGNYAEELKEDLIKNNPSGAKGGLNYYSEEDLTDIETSKRVAQEIKANIHNFERQADGSFKKTELSNKQVASAVALLSAAAKRLNMSLSTYVDKTFGSNIFGSQEDFTKAANLQGDSVSGKAGGVNPGVAQAKWQDFGQSVKAVIYAGENADFSTWAHELAHIFQNQLEGDLKAQAEKAFNVINGDWINSKYTFKDGHVDSAAEAFAYGFQDWLKTGKTESEEMKNIFEKFAEFIARAFNSLKEFINLTPEIESVYNQLLSGDDSLLAKAERAVEENDRAYRQSMQDQKQQAAEKAKADEESAKKAAEAEREEKSEVTEEAQNIPTAEELSENVEKIIDETETQTSDNAINNAIENLSVSDETKAKTEEVLNDPNSTQIDKAEAITEATGEEYKALGDMLFQMTQEVGEEKAKEAFNQIMGKGKVLFQVTDLTQDFADTKNGIITQEDVENYINSLIGQLIDTATAPLKIRIIGNRKIKKHIIETKVKLVGNQKYRHNAALSRIEEIINNAEKVGEEPKNSKHNTNEQTIKHKEKVLNYIIFNSPVKIGNENFIVIMKAEETLGQSPDVLNLYNVQVKKSSGAAALSNNSTLQTTANGDNNTTTTGNVNKTLFQIAGEIGAANLDKNEEVAEGVSRMQNLAIAKEMEADGKDAKTIRLATGWEKGSDGKWRYEIDDSNVKLYDEQLFPKRHLDKDEEYERIEKEIKAADYDIEAIPVQDLQYWESVNDSESDFVREYIDFDGGKTKWKKTADLERILNAPELFKAYPQLKKIQFYTEKLPSGYLGRFESMKNRIVLDPMAGLRTLLHEIQHAIQEIEGFAKGGTSQQFEDKQIAELEDEIKGHQNNIDLWNKDIKLGDFVTKSIQEVAAGKKDMSQHWQDLEDYVNNSEYAKEINAEKKRIKELQEQIDIIKAETTDKRTAEQKYNALAGEVESRNVEERIKLTPEQRLNTLLSETEDVAQQDKIILFQTVYHGSPHNFDAFSTENIGTGEGAQAFGWGLYFTNQESIARFYADKLANEPARLSLISKNDFLKSRKKSLKDVENKEKYEARIYKNINHFNKELKQAQKAKDESEIKFYQGLIDDSVKQLDENERLSLIESFKKDIKKAEQEIKELKASMKKNRNLYTVDIPDEGYLQWDKHVSLENIEGIKAALKDRGVTDFSRLDNLIENQEKWKDNPNATYTLGGNIYKVISDYLGGDKAASLFLKDLGYIGIDYPAHSLAGSVTEDERNYVIFDERNAQITNHLLFQKAYHGSGADFDKFNTGLYGFSGEGSMSFGYGTYLTDNEEIARDYAERQRKRQLNQESENPYETGTLEREVFEDLRYFNFSKPSFKKYLETQVENIKKDPDNPYQDFKASEKLAILDNLVLGEDDNKTNLYTVEIPDNGYIQWDKTVRKQTTDKVKRELLKEIYSNPDSAYYSYDKKDLSNELDQVFSYVEGMQLYNNVSAYLEGDENASKFFKKIGYAGIKYPAGTIHGNGQGAYNYVIFNDEDAKIVDHLLFQTQAELLEEARSFDTWQEFMDFYETMGKPEVTPIPYEADAQWYQSFWEMAHGMQTEQEKNEQSVNNKAAREGNLPPAMDALFTTSMRSNPEMLDNFLKMAAWVDAIDFDSEEWKAESEVDAQEREKYERLKDFISFSLSDYNWQTAMKRVRSGNEISEGLRKRLIGEVTDSFKVRDFRALYAELMEDSEYAVAEEDTIAAQLGKKLQKYQKRYYDILKPSEDISRVSPERRKQIAEAMANRDIANKIANGSLKLDDELDNYIKSLKKQADDAQKRVDELEAETKADYQRIADAERRKLLKIHEELLIAKSKLNGRNTEISRKVNKGLSLTEKYKRASQNLQANYNEVYRKFEDLKNSIQINAEVNAALERQEQLAGLKEDLNAKKKEQNLAAEVKKIRIQLVKRVMRRVPFNRIDYNNARTVIAIQRILEPNLIGGVNKFIGIDSPYLRGVISQIVTDKDFKEKVLRYLSKSQKSSQAFVNFKKKIEEMKSVDDLNSWTRKEREYAIKHLPKENWIRDLNLESLAQEREKSIDLDIGTEEVRKPVIDPKTGMQKVYKVNGEDVPAYEVSQRVTFSDEIAQEVRDAVGQDMFDLMVNVPFSEWTTEQLETLAKRVDELYTEGRELLAAKNEARKREAEHLRNLVEDAIKETGITINDDDTPEERKKKLARIAKIVGNNKDLKGTEAGKESGIKARLNRLLHGYADMNVLRFARMLDNNVEGINTRLLYREEDACFNAKQRSINARTKAVYGVMEANNITEADLAKTIRVKEGSLDTVFTVDELLYFLAADKDYELDDKGRNDNFAATSRNAVMFGNMMSDNESQEKKELWDKADKDMKELIENDALDANQRQLLAIGQLDKTPGTTAFIFECNERWKAVIGTAQNFIDNYPKYKALMEAIEGDYASQYERMNEVSINEFNQPVHRVKAYVPLVRRESNGDTNVNQVKEDLLGAFGAEAGKQWVNKGMTQRRQNIAPLHQKPVQTGLFATWGSSIERTEHFIAYSPYVRKLNTIYKSRDASYTRRFIEARYGKPAVEYLDSYINEVANPNANKIREKGAEFLHALRGRTAPAYLGWKFSAIIKQGLTSPFPYMQFVNPAEYFAALSDFTHKETREMILEKSAFMRSRSFDPLKDLVEEMADSAKSEKGKIGEIDRWWTEFGRMGMKGLEMIDWACVSPGWLACYKKEYAKQQKMAEARYEERLAELHEKNMTVEVASSEWLSEDQMKQEASKLAQNDIELAAVQYADDCTRQCQPSSRATDLAPLFKNSSEAMKAFLQFQTSLNVIWQNIRYDIPYAIKNRQFERIAYTVIGYVMAGIFMNGVMDGLTDGADDDDDKKLQALRNVIFYSTTQFTDAIPMIGSEITNTLDQVITGKRGFAQSGTDMTPSATKILSALNKATTGDFKKAAFMTAEGIGLGIGAPVSGVKEINKLLGRPLKEGDVNLLRGVSDVYGITGDIMDAAGVDRQ